MPAFVALVLASGCASLDEDAEGRAAVPDDPIADLLADDTPAPVPAPLGPPASDFIGNPVGMLDDAKGPPSLVRREGANEFRRYDLGDCRAYAVVVPAGGNVMSLTAGPATFGEPAPDFRTCVRPPLG